MSNPSTRPPRRTIFWIFYYALWASVSLRWVQEFIEQQHPLTLVLAALLLGYALLMALEPGLTRLQMHLYLVLQTGLVLAAMLFFYEIDYFAILLLPLSTQATMALPRRQARSWVLALILVTLGGEIIQFGWTQSLSFALLYIAAILFVTLMSENVLTTEAARREGERLLHELQEAHTRLQDYAGQAEELAVAQERNRLARELHDSVAQTLYGLNLGTEAALQKLKSGEINRVQSYLEDFQDYSLQSLKEIRLLIYELRPEILAQEGLQVALTRRLEAVEARSGLAVQADIGAVDGLSSEAETAIYRIAVEALNNTLKHSQANQVSVTLLQEAHKVRLEISDNGAGFDSAAGDPGGLGLSGMQERAAQIGAQLEIESHPAEGTRVHLELPR